MMDRASIRRTPCDSFPQGYCFRVVGPPLFGLHYQTREEAEHAVKIARRPVNKAAGEKSIGGQGKQG